MQVLRVRGPVPAAFHGVAVDVGGVHELARHALPVPGRAAGGGRGGGRWQGRAGAGVLALRAPPGPPVGAHGRGARAAGAPAVQHPVAVAAQRRARHPHAALHHLRPHRRQQ